MDSETETMPNYRLVLFGDQGARGRSGYVFCAGPAQAAAAADVLAQLDPETETVQVFDGPRLLCLRGREPEPARRLAG